MNKERRKLIDEALDKIEAAKADLETARDEEQEYLDNMPENMRDGDKGQAAQEAIDNLESCINDIDNAINNGRSASE